MDDLISRQAAIGVVSERCGICIQRIVDLPSVQPEIIRCKDCKCWDTSGYCIDFMTQDEGGFCKWAERRQDALN